MRMEAEGGVTLPQGAPKTPEAWHRWALSASGRCSPDDTPSLGFQPPGHGDKEHLLFKLPQETHKGIVQKHAWHQLTLSSAHRVLHEHRLSLLRPPWLAHVPVPDS